MAPSRRGFLKSASIAGVAAVAGSSRAARASAQTRAGQGIRMVQTPVLDIGYEEHGDSGGFPILLLHGFPYDVRSWDGWCRLWPPPDTGCWCRIFAATAPPGFANPPLRGWGSKRRSHKT